MYIDVTKGAETQRLNCGWIVETAKGLQDLAKANGVVAVHRRDNGQVHGLFVFSLTAAREEPEIEDADKISHEIATYYHTLLQDYKWVGDLRVASITFYGNCPPLLGKLAGTMYTFPA